MEQSTETKSLGVDESLDENECLNEDEIQEEDQYKGSEEDENSSLEGDESAGEESSENDEHLAVDASPNCQICGDLDPSLWGARKKQPFDKYEGLVEFCLGLLFMCCYSGWRVEECKADTIR